MGATVSAAMASLHRYDTCRTTVVRVEKNLKSRFTTTKDAEGKVTAVQRRAVTFLGLKLITLEMLYPRGVTCRLGRFRELNSTIPSVPTSTFRVQ